MPPFPLKSNHKILRKLGRASLDRHHAWRTPFLEEPTRHPRATASRPARGAPSREGATANIALYWSKHVKSQNTLKHVRRKYIVVHVMTTHHGNHV